MARVTEIRVTLDKAKVNSLLIETGNLSTQRAALRVRDRARDNAPVNSGALRRSITARKVQNTADRTTYSVGSDLSYSAAQESGRGPVFARRGGVLRFRPRGTATYVFRPRARAARGKRYLARAYQSMTIADYLP